MRQVVKDLEYLRKTELLIAESMNFLLEKNNMTKKNKQNKLKEFILRNINSTKTFIEKLNRKEDEMIQEIDFEKKKLALSKKIEKVNDEIQIKIKEEINTVDKKIEKIENIALNTNNTLNHLLEVTGFTYEDDEFADGKMYFFNDNTKNLITIDVSLTTDSLTLINSPENLSPLGGFCRISEDKIFLHSGYRGGSYTNSIFIVDLKQGIAEKRESFKLGFLGSCSRFKNNVYAFGGHDGSAPSTACRKFDLNSDTWQSIQNLPISTHCNSTAILDDNIFIAGFNIDSVYTYNISNNSYSNIGSFQSHWNKILCKASKKIYLFENNKLHESTDDNPKKFSVINSSTGVSNNYLISFTTRFKNDLYFVLNNKSIYKINILTKVINLVRSVTQ
ncbi:hypothetical protein SteCoe_5633 [Stentor coeruleus]|uniref:Uncharacterized protein n=1 Tax=Stentor coeruleus TaxID=5963 RepID=A0A1R2CRX5_9CILI|nr:hypothetical protein SteCoe_5633 [Stentor coeruleus]